MTDTPTVRVTIASLGEGEETIELEPGESISEAADGPSYLEVEALEVVPAEPSDDDDSEDDGEAFEFDVDDTEYEQQDDGGDREWEVDRTQCSNCGDHYPADYSRCQKCGTPNRGAQ